MADILQTTIWNAFSFIKICTKNYFEICPNGLIDEFVTNVFLKVLHMSSNIIGTNPFHHMA